jgi:hypothetical protein
MTRGDGVLISEVEWRGWRAGMPPEGVSCHVVLSLGSALAGYLCCMAVSQTTGLRRHSYRVVRRLLCSVHVVMVAKGAVASNK